MADVTAKVVDIIAPGGATLNYVGITGLTKKQVMPVTLIKKALERGCVVYEHKDDGTTVKLDLTNYKDDSTGGTVVPEGTIMPPDLEDLDEARKAAEEEARLEAASEYWKQYYEELAKDDPDPVESILELTGSATIESTENKADITGSVEVQATEAGDDESLESASALSRKATTNTFKKAKK